MPREGAGHVAAVCEPVTQRLAKIAGVRKGRVLETLWGGPQEHLVVAFPSGFPCVGGVKPASILGAAVSPARGQRGHTRHGTRGFQQGELMACRCGCLGRWALTKGSGFERCVGGLCSGAGLL